MAVRVFQIAKEYSRTPDEIMSLLHEAGIEVASQTSPLDEHALHTLRAKLGKYKLLVVEGQSEEQVTVDEASPGKTPKPKSNKKRKPEPNQPPPPRLGVRVIKKQEESATVEEEETAPPSASPEKPALARPKLRRTKARLLNIEKQINKAIGVETPRETTSRPPRTQTQAPPTKGPTGPAGPPVAAIDSQTGQPKRPPKRKERPLFQKGDKRGGPSEDPLIAMANQAPFSSPKGEGRGGPGSASFGRGGRPTTDQGPVPGRGGGGRPKNNVYTTGRKKRKKKRNVEQIAKIKPINISRVELPTEELGIIMLSEGVTVKELAEKVNRKAKDVIKRLFEKGIMATLNDVLDTELALEIAKDFGYLAEIVSFEEDLQIQETDLMVTDDTDVGAMEPRAPIVTIMGHVDHGKTTLLDQIRKTKVASGEAGGITQHIGAYTVNWKGKDIVFLDTPGHEAFTKMRARGASVTDIVILVVAADDGVKPQTIEAISHAKAAKVPIIVCINKIDKPESNPERVKQMLTEHELVVEDFGGDSPAVLVSAKMNQGIDDLLEVILLVDEMNECKANPSRKAQGTVIEAKLDRGRGPVATVMVQNGTLVVGEYFITGATYGKVRAMYDESGEPVESAPPSTPVEILGFQEVPAAGDSFQVVSDEGTARQISAFRKQRVREDQFRHQKHTTLDQLFSKLNQDEVKELALIVKSDVQGSVEGLAHALAKLESKRVQLRIVHQAVGGITENDVLLAVASDAIIIGFNVKPERKAQELAESEQIEIRQYSVIYEVVKDVESAMLGLMAPEYEEREIGKAIVKQIFSVAKIGVVAGCQVESGHVTRDAGVRVMRGSEEIFKGVLLTLKRFRDDVNEVKSGFECGIGIRGFSDFHEQDQLVFTVQDKVVPTQL